MKNKKSKKILCSWCRGKIDKKDIYSIDKITGEIFCKKCCQ